MDVAWTPIAGHHAGMVAISLCAIISSCSVVALLCFCAWRLRQYSLLSTTARLAAETRGIKFLLSDHLPLLISLLSGDLISAIGFAMNIGWLVKGAYPAEMPTAACTTQSVLIELGDVASVLGSLLIGVHIAAMLVLSYRLTRPVIYGGIALIWIVAAVFTALGPSVVATEGQPFYGWAGGWCWIGSHHAYQQYKLWFHYFWVFSVGIANLCLYTIVFVKLVRGSTLVNGTQMGGATASAARSMIFYPLVYLATVLPLSCYRIAALTGHPWSFRFELGAGCIFTSSGFVNCLVYAITRKIVPMGTLFLRGSSNSTSREGNTNGNIVKLRSFKFSERSGKATTVGAVSAGGGVGVVGGFTSLGIGGAPVTFDGVPFDEQRSGSRKDLSLTERMVSFAGAKGEEDVETRRDDVELKVWTHQ